MRSERLRLPDFQPEITIDNKTFGKTNPVESVGRKITFVINIGGQGKVWGNLNRMTLSKVKKPSNVRVLNKPSI